MNTLRAKIWITLFVVIFGFSLIVAVFNDRAGIDSGAARISAGPDRAVACWMSQEFVRQQLKAPSTAEFPARTEANCNAIQTGRIWKVRSYVDAQNSFGAMLRSDYSVEMVYDASHDNWILMDIVIAGP